MSLRALTAPGNALPMGYVPPGKNGSKKHLDPLCSSSVTTSASCWPLEQYSSNLAAEDCLHPTPVGTTAALVTCWTVFHVAPVHNASHNHQTLSTGYQATHTQALMAAGGMHICIGESRIHRTDRVRTKLPYMLYRHKITPPPAALMLCSPWHGGSTAFNHMPCKCQQAMAQAPPSPEPSLHSAARTLHSAGRYCTLCHRWGKPLP